MKYGYERIGGFTDIECPHCEWECKRAELVQYLVFDDNDEIIEENWCCPNCKKPIFE